MTGPVTAKPRLASPCEVCRSWAAGSLCEPCLQRFAPPRLRCSGCALPLAQPTSADAVPGAPLPRCGPCLREPPPWSRAASALDYGFPWDRLIADFKFRRRPELAGALAGLLAQAVRDAPRAAAVDAALPPVALVLPVPLSRQRLVERGFNQAWELARRVARELGLPADAQTLVRVVDTPHLPGLARDERLAGLRGAFMVEPRRRAAVAGRHLALVDDVLTSGATAVQACDTLLRAGAASVQLWTLARTPAPAG